MKKLSEIAIVTASLLLFFLGSSAFASPTNDFLAHPAFILFTTNTTVSGNNSGGTLEVGEDAGDTNVNYLYSVWYSYTAPTNGIVYLKGSNSVANFLMDIRAYTGTAIANLVPVSTNADGGVPVSPNEKLAIRVSTVFYPATGVGGGSGAFKLLLSTLAPTPASTNDIFANRATITTPGYHFEGSIYGAGTESGEPLAVPGTTETLWWAFSPSNTGVLELEFKTDYFTPLPAVYDGTAFGSMTPIAPLASNNFFLLQAGHDYSVQMGSAVILAGNFSLDAIFYERSNDFFAGATHLTGDNIFYQGNFTGATAETGEPISVATNTVWAAWTPQSNGVVTFSLAAASQSQYITAYQGATLAALLPVTLTSASNFTATVGTIYYFQISGGGDDFTLVLSETRIPPANNDNFADATVVAGRTASGVSSITSATMETNEPLHLGNVAQKSVWWKWVAPNYGSGRLSSQGSDDPRAIVAVYSGSTLANLKLLAIGSNNSATPTFPMIGGETYYFAGVAPDDAVGNINLNLFTLINSDAHIVPGNLLLDPSWENTHLNLNHWQSGSPLSGYTGDPGGVDGGTWPVLNPGQAIWQDITVQPGHTYAVKFAYAIGGCCGDAKVGVYYGVNRIGTGNIPVAEGGFWHWSEFTFTPSSTTARILFTNEASNLQMDAFSVVDISIPPFIVAQPESITVVTNGTASFQVSVGGENPEYQWFFKEIPILGATDGTLVINAVTTNQTGDYYVIASNSFGAVTSVVASLYVDSPLAPVILWQPYSGYQPAGIYFTLSVAAIGQAPFIYQWYTNGVAIPSSTNQTIVFGSLSPTDAATYTVTIQNSFGKVASLPTTLTVSTTNIGGGMINSSTREVGAAVLDVDGTRLSGGTYRAQLYAGPSLELLRPAGPLQLFYTYPPVFLGYIKSLVVTLPNVPARTNALAQLRVWDSSTANSYEEARALGGKFGASAIVTVTTGGFFGNDPVPDFPGNLTGMPSFSLHAGLPKFETAKLDFISLQDDGSTVWTLTGEPNYRYLIEQNVGNNFWQPYSIVTNVTGMVTFTNAPVSTNTPVFYRSRILD